MKFNLINNKNFQNYLGDNNKIHLNVNHAKKFFNYNLV